MHESFVYLDGALHDATTDADVASEGALLVNVVTRDGLKGGLEAETDVLVVAKGLAALLGLGTKDTGGALEDGRLLLESLLGLLNGICRMREKNRV